MSGPRSPRWDNLANMKLSNRKLSPARLVLIALCALPAVLAAQTPENSLNQAAKLELSGKFVEASNVLNGARAESPSADQSRQIEFELDRLNRIRLDYSLTREALFGALQRSVRGLTTNEFGLWAGEGWFDSRTIDGRQFFMNSSVANLYFRHPELNPRRMDGKDHTIRDHAILASCRAIRQAALLQGTPYVLPKRFDMTMTVTADADAAPAGQIIRAWLPIPRAYPYQKDFEVVSSTPTVKEIAPADSSIRSAYFEAVAQAGQPTSFTLRYRYTRCGVSFIIDPRKVTPFDGTDPALAAFTHEGPNVVFMPEMRALSRQIAGGERNPALLARKFYDWIGAHTHYSYAIEYSTIRNVGDYCRSHGYGDCGQEAMFFITLCRLNGIPARWQSGWHTFPGIMDIHDWSEIYLAPYGWVPVDPYMCVMASYYATTLTPAECDEVRNFYFGGLDQYRMAANDDQSQLLSPPKLSFRSDNVDFQRAELEWSGHNIYFNHFSYHMDVKALPARAITAGTM